MQVWSRACGAAVAAEAEVGEGLEREGLVGVEFDQQHRRFVVLHHALDLVVQTSVGEGADQVAHAFALDADIGGEDVVANG